MPADSTVYDSERLARAYAGSRPPLHAAICRRLVAALPPDFAARSALDIGCGAGASTAALLPWAQQVFGIDPYLPMIRQAALALPSANFARGSAENTHFGDNEFDLITAAGSLNYTEPLASLKEIARVLAPSGFFAPYDFSTGRDMAQDDRLTERFAAFRRRFPSPPGYALDLAALPYPAAGLQLIASEAFELSVPLSAADYVAYLMSDAGVESAIAKGLPEALARHYCELEFAPLFGAEARQIRFGVQLAIACKPGNARSHHGADHSMNSQSAGTALPHRTRPAD